MALQSDAKILVGGEVPGGIVRLNPNGSLDRGFKDFGAGGVSPRDQPIAVRLQPDGRILLGGLVFASWNSSTPQLRQGVARVNLDGTLDTSFDAGGGFYHGSDDEILRGSGYQIQWPVSSILLLPDGSLLVGGGFTSFDGLPRRGLARLRGDPQPRWIGITETGQRTALLNLNSLPGRTYVTEASEDLQTWVPARTNRATSYQLNIEDAEASNSGHRFYRAVSP